MAAVTAIQNTTKKGLVQVQAYPVKSGEKIVQGALATVATADGLLYDLDAAIVAAGSGTVGFVADGSENNNATAPSVDGSISGDRVEGSGLSNGEKTVRKLWTTGRFLITTATGLTQADVDAKLYASDNFTFTKTLTSNKYVGRIDAVISATECWLELDSKGLGA